MAATPTGFAAFFMPFRGEPGQSWNLQEERYPLCLVPLKFLDGIRVMPPSLSNSAKGDFR